MKLSTTEAARLLDATPEQIYEWIKEGSIPFYRISDQYRFHQAELLEWATARGRRVSVELFHAEPQSGQPLVDALAAGGIHRDLAGTDRNEVLRAVVRHLPLADEGDREVVTDILIARGAAASTVGDGIAIPHVRQPIILHGTKSVISLAFLAHPVDFDAVDRKPVHTIFMMVTPTPKVHLALLSRLSSALCDVEFKAAIARRAPDREILAEAGRVEASFKTTL